MLSSLVKKAAVAGGIPAAIRARKGARLRILMYHRFAGDRRSLGRQLQHIRRYYAPISLTDACAAILGGDPLPANALAITVDDGYADFARAWPVFQEFGLPVTLFVVSRFVEGSIWLWPDVVLYCLRSTGQARVSFPLPDGSEFRRDCETPAQRAAADAELDRILVAAPDAFRRAVIADLPRWTGVELPSAIPPEFAAVSPEDLREMAASGLAVGAHTRTHPILSRLEDEDAVCEEIAGSKRDLEQALGQEVRHFCYPNGAMADYNAETCRVVQQTGFVSAVTSRRGLNAPGAKRFELMRVGVNPEMPMETFALELAGYRMA